MNENNENENQNNGREPQNGREPYRDPSDPSQQPYGPGGYPPPKPPYVQYNTAETIRLFCILAYIPLLWLVGLIAERENPKVKFHVNQGIILTVFTVIVSVAVSILKGFVTLLFTLSSFGTGIFIPLGALINGLLSLAAFMLFVAFAVIGILHAAQGREEPLPIIGNAFHIVR